MLLALSHCTSVLATEAFQCTIQFESLVCTSLHGLYIFIACLLWGEIGYLFIVYTNTFRGLIWAFYFKANDRLNGSTSRYYASCET